MLARSRYRVRQFSNVFRGACSAAERGLIERYLNREQQRLFWNMQPLARRHHLDVARDLLDGGWDSPDLIAAALLHDVGKGHLGVWPRVAVVLTKALAPALFEALARRGGPPPAAWLWLHAHHAEIGAALVAATGASARTVELVRRHESCTDGDPDLAALRAADDRH